MSEIVSFLAEQSVAVRTALYIVSLLFLLFVGGLALSLVIAALDSMGRAMTDDPDWQISGGLSSKEDLLHAFAVVIYGGLLVSVEPPIRALEGVLGNVLVTSLMFAPIAGLIVLNPRKPSSSEREREPS